MVSGGCCEGLFPDTVCWTRLRNTWEALIKKGSSQGAPCGVASLKKWSKVVTSSGPPPEALYDSFWRGRAKTVASRLITQVSKLQRPNLPPRTKSTKGQHFGNGQPFRNTSADQTPASQKHNVSCHCARVSAHIQAHSFCLLAAAGLDSQRGRSTSTMAANTLCKLLLSNLATPCPPRFLSLYTPSSSA